MAWARFGVYGGTFNPLHTGHLIIAQEVYDQFALDRVFFVPSARPPHKHQAALIAPEHRYAMTAIATQDDLRFEVSDIELQRPGPSYSIETLREFHRRYGPDCQLFFIIGADSLVEIGTWRNPDELFALCSVVVVPRPGVDLRQAAPSWRDRALVVQSLQVDISSTDIRRRIEAGRSIRYLVPAGVEQYIREHRLYQAL